MPQSGTEMHFDTVSRWEDWMGSLNTTYKVTLEKTAMTVCSSKLREDWAIICRIMLNGKGAPTRFWHGQKNCS
jgi:hypothetical protein